MVERLAGLSAEVDLASEFRYRDAVVGPGASRRFAVGAEVTYQLPLTALDRSPMFLYAGPRLVARWGG